VRVTRPNVVVRARRGHVTPKKASVTTNSKSPSTPELREALDSPLPISGLTMHAFSAPFKGTAPNASVLFGVELRGRDMKLDQSTKLLLSYIAIDSNGKLRGGNTDSVGLTSMRPETKNRIEQTGLRILNRLDLPPGKYQFRIAAHDTNGGNVGSVLLDLDVPDFLKAPLSMSGLALTSGSGSAMPTVKQDEQLKAVMPGPALALRSFPQNDEVLVFAEIYDNQGGTPHKVDISATVTADEGKVMFKTDEVRDSSEIGGARGGYGFTARIPMKDLAPGTYVLKVEAMSRLSNVPTVSRETLIKVEPPRGGPGRGAGR
jgi:hypothetical protein